MNQKLFFVATAEFESARRVTLLPEGHRSRRLHGHSFLAEVRCCLPDNWATFDGAEVDELKEHVCKAVFPLDYNELNKEIEQPTDENLARWIRDRIGLPGIERIGISSTSHEGVDIDKNDNAHIWRRYIFQSAHQLPNVPVGHKCGRMHGHGFEVIIHANQDLGDNQMGIDYDYLDQLWAPIFAELDHACLNDIVGLENPTSEIISSWIWKRLKPELPELSWVTVYETASCGAHFDGKNYRIWKEMTLDSAVYLKSAPEGDPRRKIHGHTYTLRLHLQAPLDAVMGWTVDFGDVKELFNPVFNQLDHNPLYEMPGIDNADIASIARWIKNQVSPLIPQLDRIDLYQTRGCGVVLTWGDMGPEVPI